MPTNQSDGTANKENRLNRRNDGRDPVASIRDVAQEAGVSIATVSYVLNDTRKVRPETRRRVLRAVSQLSYSPNTSARNLAMGRSPILGLIVSDIRNPFFPEITAAFQEAANLNEMESIVMNTNYNPQKTKASVDRLLGWRVAGIAILTSEIDPSVMSTLASRKVCTVYLDLGKANQYISNISIDYQHGITAALMHARQLGHRCIGFIGGLPNLLSAQRRKHAFLAGAAKVGFANTKIVDSDFTVQGGYVACARLLARFPATAIIAANDLMAIGAIHYAHDHRIAIPDDLSIIGFDDISFAESTHPPLTTVAVPRSEIGRIAFDALWAMIAHPERSGSEFSVKTNLTIRDSTASAPQPREQLARNCVNV